MWGWARPNVLPWYLDLISRLAPLRYAVDPTCGVYHAGSSEAARVVLAPVGVNPAVGGMFAAFLVVGTALFARGNATGRSGCEAKARNATAKRELGNTERTRPSPTLIAQRSAAHQTGIRGARINHLDGRVLQRALSGCHYPSPPWT